MPSISLRRIVHPTDRRQNSEFAFYHALRIAVAAHSQLDVIHVEKDAFANTWEDFPDASRTLTAWGFPPDVLSSANGDLVRTITAYGREPVGPILEYMDESLPDMVVLATHRRHGIDRWLHKVVAQKLIQSRAIPTLFVPYGEEGFVSPTQGTAELHRVLLPVDWLPEPQAAVDAAADVVDVLGCEEVTFTLLHVSDRSEAVLPVRCPERPGWTWDHQTRSGEVVHEVLRVAEERDADLIVMVTQGRDGFLDALRGSTTERVLQKARCPVLAVPA